MLRLPQERCSNGVDIYIMELTFYSKRKRKSFNKQGSPPSPSFLPMFCCHRSHRATQTLNGHPCWQFNKIPYSSGCFREWGGQSACWELELGREIKVRALFSSKAPQFQSVLGSTLVLTLCTAPCGCRIGIGMGNSFWETGTPGVSCPNCLRDGQLLQVLGVLGLEKKPLLCSPGSSEQVWDSRDKQAQLEPWR